MKKSMAPSKTKTMPVNSSDARTPGIIRPDGKYSFQSSGKAKATVSKKGKLTTCFDYIVEDGLSWYV